jgi:hypothetical protein
MFLSRFRGLMGDVRVEFESVSVVFAGTVSLAGIGTDIINGWLQNPFPT